MNQRERNDAARAEFLKEFGAVFPYDRVDEPSYAAVLEALPPTMAGWAMRLWWATPNDLLAHARPADVVASDPGAVVAAARAEARAWHQAE